MVKEKYIPDQQNTHNTSKLLHLVVYNDNFNTFDFVIDTLIDICHHDPEQAEQCTLIIHHKGKCAVKSGTMDDLRVMCEKINERQISAKIE